jgi:hypothetical protein
MSPSPADGTYMEGYGTMQFKEAGGIAGTFYPFYSQAGYGQACVFNFGNDIPGVTTSDFSKSAQYGVSMNNPCLPGLPDYLIVLDNLPLL